jgi:hypothetical protein
MVTMLTARAQREMCVLVVVAEQILDDPQVV